MIFYSKRAIGDFKALRMLSIYFNKKRTVGILFSKADGKRLRVGFFN